MGNVYDDMTEEEQALFDQGMDEWMRMCADTEPSESQLDDMEMQSFYTHMEQRPSIVDMKKLEDVRLLRQDLYQLQDYQKRGMLEKYPPSANFEDVKSMTLDSPMIAGDKRLDNVFEKLAQRLENVVSQCNNEVYQNQVDSGVSFQDAQNAHVNEIKQCLQNGNATHYQTFVADIEHKLESSQDLKNFDLSFSQNVFDDLSFDELVNHYVETNQKISSHVIDIVNEKIVEEQKTIDETYLMGCEQAESYFAMADKSSQLREENGIDENDLNLPAYLESEIGSSLTPDELQDMAHTCLNDALSVHQSDLDDFYGRVYGLERYDFSDVSVDVTGRRKDGSKASPVLVKSDTLQVLGNSYESYKTERFSRDLQDMRSRHVSDTSMLRKDSVMADTKMIANSDMMHVSESSYHAHKMDSQGIMHDLHAVKESVSTKGILGIDVTKSVQVNIAQSQMEVSKQLSNVEPKPLKPKEVHQNQRRMPQNSHGQEIYNEANENDDWSYDDLDKQDWEFGEFDK